MPKLKSHRGAAKRFKITGRGKVRRQKAFHSHLLTKKHPKRKRQLRQPTSVHPGNVQSVKRLLSGSGT
jgi:large subunit ribosomal protein L35